MTSLSCCAAARSTEPKAAAGNIPVKVKIIAGNVGWPRVFKSTGSGVGLPYRKSGETDEQISSAFDAGHVRDGADRGAAAHISPRRGRRQSLTAGIGQQEGKEEE